jgi:hypothetical protein
LKNDGIKVQDDAIIRLIKLIALLLTNQIARNAIDFKMDIMTPEIKSRKSLLSNIIHIL